MPAAVGKHLKNTVMDKKTYERYRQDKQIVKLGEYQGRHFLHPETKTVVFFAFFYNGIPYSIYGEPEKRILFDIYDLKRYQGILPLSEINSVQYILANTNHQDFALLFKITIDGKAGKAKLTLQEYPECGVSLITDVERNGIELKLKK